MTSTQENCFAWCLHHASMLSPVYWNYDLASWVVVKHTAAVCLFVVYLHVLTIYCHVLSSVLHTTGKMYQQKGDLQTHWTAFKYHTVQLYSKINIIIKLWYSSNIKFHLYLAWLHKYFLSAKIESTAAKYRQAFKNQAQNISVYVNDWSFIPSLQVSVNINDSPNDWKCWLVAWRVWGEQTALAIIKYANRLHLKYQMSSFGGWGGL